MTVLGLVESSKTMNRPGQSQTRPVCNAFSRLISEKVYKMGTWNFHTIFIQVFNLCYQNLGLISLMVWKLCAFRQCRKFGNLQQFFHHNFRLKWKFWILIDSSEISSSIGIIFLYFRTSRKCIEIIVSWIPESIL